MRGPPTPTDVFLLLHGGVLAHVVVASIDPDGVMHDAVHDGIGVDPGAEPLVPVFFGVLGAEYGRCSVVPSFKQFQQHAAHALVRRSPPRRPLHSVSRGGLSSGLWTPQR